MLVTQPNDQGKDMKNRETMAYNNRNKLVMYKRVLEVVNQHYEEGVTTYAGVWRRHVYPRYPMSYQTFMRIINMPGLDDRIRRAGPPPKSARMSANQLTLF